jgi:hypothetical protein
MNMNPRGSFFDRAFGPGCSEFWGQKMAWQAQKAAWRAQRHAQRAAWKAQREAQKAAWRAQWHANRWHYRGPFAALWGLLWTAFWIGLVALLIFSPEFRTSAINFMLAIPKFVVHLLYAVTGQPEI